MPFDDSIEHLIVYTVNVGSISLTVSPSTLPNGRQNIPYSQTVTASGGSAPYHFTVENGTLPVGLSLNATSGAITGTPTGIGPSSFTIRATDVGAGHTGTRDYTVNIDSLVISPATLPPATEGVPYDQIVSATGGIGPYMFFIEAGALPTGLALNAMTGEIHGTPIISGSFTFTLEVVDTGTQSWSGEVFEVWSNDPWQPF